MKRKGFVSVIVSIILVSCLSMSCFAADAEYDVGGTVIAENQLAEVVDSVVGELIGTSENAVVEVQADDILSDVDTDGDGEATAGEVSQSLSKYMFVKYDEVEAISQRIADSARYTVVVLENGKSTVYISVNIEENPEIMNLDVFRETVKKLFSAQTAYTTSEGVSYDLLDYEKIAGELALHAIVYAMTVTTGQNSAGNDLYDRSKVADLNIDEDRFPQFGIDFIGTIIMDIIFATFYNIYLIFK